jgi:hypothetical protein
LNSYCRSAKGWTENEIAVDYLQWFDEHTRSKLAPGEKRLLLLDGHVSHFSKAFIERALELDIVVLCYPPHSTHIFQGLDVVLFSRAKAEWTKSRDKWEFETGEGVTKETFLQVFGEAYIAAFTPENNKKAFEKTGVHPFNRHILQPKDLAPSIEHSKHATLPMQIPPHVEAFIGIFRQAMDQEGEDDEEIGPGNDWETDDEDDNDGSNAGADDDEDDPGLHSNDNDVHHPILFRPRPATNLQNPMLTPDRPTRAVTSAPRGQLAIGRTPAHRRLRSALQASTPLRPLLRSSSFNSPARMPKRVYLRPTTRVHWDSLPRPATSLADENSMLREQLRKAKLLEDEYKTCLEVSHSQLAMAGMYAETCRQRAVAASKKSKGGKGRRVNATGFARIVSDAQLLEELERMDEEEEQLARDKEARREARKAKGAAAERHKAFMAARRQAWDAAKAKHEELVAEWEREGRFGKKPQRPKQLEVYVASGLDAEDRWEEEQHV